MNRIHFVAMSLVFLLVVSALGCSYQAPERSSAPVDASPAPASSASEAKTPPPASTAKPYFIPAGTAPAVWGPGDLYNMLATGDQTNNGSFQFEAFVPKGGGPPPHIHRNEDESFYIVKGTLDVQLGDKVYSAKAGDFIYVPRGTVHRFINTGEETALQLVTFVPAGMEGFFKDAFHTATTHSVPGPPDPDIIKRMTEAAPKYGVEFVPMPESAKK